MPTESRRPNLFLVGSQKSGTTTLAVMFSRHPDIFMCMPKEPGYLAFGEQGYRGLDGYGRLAHAASWVIDSESDYLHLFANAPKRARWLGDASTWYLSEPQAAANIHAFNPEARIIAILRQPARRAYSAWCHARRDGEEPCEDFEQALAMEQERDAPSHLLRYREMSLYSEQLKRYFERFGKERVLVLLYEDLRDRPEWLWRQCCEFLDISGSESAPQPYRQNRSGQPRSRLLHRLLRSERFKQPLKRVLPTGFAAWMKNRFDAVNLSRFPPMPESTFHALSREFEDEIHELMSLTGRDLRHWLPDD